MHLHTLAATGLSSVLDVFIISLHGLYSRFFDLSLCIHLNCDDYLNENNGYGRL